jgi:hypothetical protein
VLLTEQQINAVMITIKPGLFNIVLKKFTPKMISKYLHSVRLRDYYHLDPPLPPPSQR